MKQIDMIQPSVMAEPLAANGPRNTIPAEATGTEYASVDTGFPQITMTAISDGGLPPRGEDCNGMFYMSTDQKVYLQNGGVITFSEEVSNTIGGYPQNAILDYIDSNNSYHKVQSLIDDNTYNFVTNPEYINNEYWKEISLGGGGGGGLEIGDIGIAPLGIDETKGKRRYLNGQLILQDQYVQFTNKVKSAVALYPSLACTESEWQTTATMTVGGQVGKFVVDDEAGTIRLPKIIMPIRGLTDLSSLAEIVEAGLPNITGNVYGLEAGGADGAFLASDWKQTGNDGADVNIRKANFNASRSSSIYGKSGTVRPEAIQYPYFIQVATGAETEDNIINEIELNNPFSLLDYKYSEYELNNLSWLRSNGQYNAKAIYPAVYDLLLKIYNGTETKAGVSVKLTTETFTDYDFVLNTADETFRLPLKTNLIPLDTSATVSVYGNGKGLGITDGTNSGTVRSWGQYLAGIKQNLNSKIGVSADVTNNFNDAKVLGIVTNGSDSGLTGSVDTSYQADLYLYFYVGETVQNANLVNIGRIQEQYTTKSMVDGQWVSVTTTLASSFSLAKNAVATYNLGSILPNDGYNYEVWFTVTGVTGATSGNTAEIRIGSDLMGSSFNIVCANTTRSSATVNYAGTTVTPVSVSRNINITNTGNATASITFLRMAGYRRIGTNL